MTYYIQYEAGDKRLYSAHLISKYDFEQKVQDLKEAGLGYVVQRDGEKTTLIVID